MSSLSGEACGFADEPQQALTIAVKKKRNLPGTPDPHAEVIALSPKTLMATNRFSCEVCGKGFQRDQNLQLHRRGHNLPWKLKQREGQEIRKKVYVCPEASCVHHEPARALGDLTGIKKHFSRKHGEKKWKCDKCSKKYAVHSDWKAHQKVCGTREYRCDCGTLFSRRDSFITHRAFCDALAEESARVSAHKPVDSQQSGGHEENTASGPSGELSHAVEAPCSPLQQSTSRPPNVEVSEASTIAALRPSSCAADVGGVSSSLSTDWVQEGIGVKPKPSKGPALSLCLGTGPGPGPPGVLPVVECSPKNEARIPFGEAAKIGDPISESGERMNWHDLSDSVGTFTRLLTSGNSDTEQQGYDLGQHESSTMVGLSFGENSFIGSSSMSHFTLPPARTVLPDNCFGNGFVLPKPSHYAGSAQLPATALLQKAAMMGATTSNPYLYRSYGVSMLSGSHGQDSWAGSSVSAYASMQKAGGVRSLDPSRGYGGDGGGSPRPLSYGGQGSVHAFMNSLCTGRPSLPKSSTSYDSSYSSGRVLMPEMIGGRSKLHENLESSRTTLDFLGVEGHGSSTQGLVAVGLPGATSQRNMASVNASNIHVKIEPITYDGNMKGRVLGDHFPK